MELSHLQIIDWESAVKLAGGKREFAEEILDFLIMTLSDDIAALQHSYQAKNYSDLLRKAHKLHGALCYCGLPRLKALIVRLETDLKNNTMDNLPSLLTQLGSETTLLLKEVSLCKHAK